MILPTYLYIVLVSLLYPIHERDLMIKITLQRSITVFETFWNFSSVFYFVSGFSGFTVGKIMYYDPKPQISDF